LNVLHTLCVEPGATVSLRAHDPRAFPGAPGKRDARKQTAADIDELQRLQSLMWSESKHSLLIVLQGLDAAGKDGTVNNVLGAMNPAGATVHSFKEPSAIEAAHDFLWRVHRVTPARGEVAVFNRSHYEDVLIARVHDLVPESIWSQRYDLINAFERSLVEAGTHVLKFFLHISPEEQLARFAKRLDDPARQWKISESDYRERAYWDAYTRAYEAVLARCSTACAPWYIIPSDRKWLRDYAIARIVVETMASWDMRYPEPSVDVADIKRRYHTAAEAEAEGGERRP
jgi:PPK2 family polyphosphate:nucleotide phosphotransferase